MEELEFEPPWYRKPLIIIGAIFVIVLLVSITFSQTIEGIIQSKRVNQDKIIFSFATVIFSNNTLEQLQNEYLLNSHREIKACLFGKVNDSYYYIERVQFPKIINANAIHIQSISCPKEVLIDLHSHPINSCLASNQDIATYQDIKARSPQAKMMVMCSKTRFALV